LAGYMKILPLFLMVWPGMIARILNPGITYAHTLIFNNDFLLSLIP